MLFGIFSIFILFSSINSPNVSTKILPNNEDVAEIDKYSEFDALDDRNLPNLITQHGKAGVNFNIDNNLPYIWCEKYNRRSCMKRTARECTTRVRCYPREGHNHLLACMATKLYSVNANTTSTSNIYSAVDDEPDLKDCWTQAASELRECYSQEECVVGTRRAGSAKKRAAKFCCCTTHDCNRKFVHKNITVITESPDVNKDEQEDSVWIGVAYIALVVMLLIGICITSVILFYTLRRYYFNLNGKKTYLKPSLNIFCGKTKDSPSTNPNLDTVALLGDQKLNLDEILPLRETANGRFAKVFEGRIGSNPLPIAIKIFPREDGESWLNEQEVYSMSVLKGSGFISEFIAAFRKGTEFWLVTKFYPNGSLYDFLKENCIDLETALRMVSTMMEGLAFLHIEVSHGLERKPVIVHRDMKSKNVLVKPDLTTCITDFGLALKCDSKRMSADENHGQVGTRRYMSPEVLEGAMEFTSFAFQQIDVYAAALVVWEVMSRTITDEQQTGNVNVSPASTPFLLPYEAEVGQAPTVGELRRRVVGENYRPKTPPNLLVGKDSPLAPTIAAIIRTMAEMWEREPDGRITSGCASARFKRFLDTVCALHKTNELKEQQSTGENDRHSSGRSSEHIFTSNCEANQQDSAINTDTENGQHSAVF